MSEKHKLVAVNSDIHAFVPKTIEENGVHTVVVYDTQDLALADGPAFIEAMIAKTGISHGWNILTEGWWPEGFKPEEPPTEYIAQTIPGQ